MTNDTAIQRKSEGEERKGTLVIKENERLKGIVVKEKQKEVKRKFQ